jgi:hypothetical protein
MNKDQKNKIKISLSRDSIYLGINNFSEEGVQVNWSDALNLYHIFEKEFGIKKNTIKKIDVLIHDSCFILIPDEFQDELYQISMMEIALGEELMKNKEIHTNHCKNIEATLNFGILSNWKDLISLEFPLAEIKYKHPLAEYLKELGKEDCFQIKFHANFMYILLQLGGKLEIANYFEFSSSLELAYYLHAIREEYGIETNSAIFEYEGIENLSSEMQKELKELNIYLNSPIHE